MNKIRLISDRYSAIRKCNDKIKNPHFTDGKSRCILKIQRRGIERAGGVDMIGWAIIAAVAAYGMVNIYNSEKHTN